MDMRTFGVSLHGSVDAAYRNMVAFKGTSKSKCSQLRRRGQTRNVGIAGLDTSPDEEGSARNSISGRLLIGTGSPRASQEVPRGVKGHGGIFIEVG